MLFEVRLTDGNNAAEGRVEILYNEIWGTICDDEWDQQDATVACRMLGYKRAVRALGNAHFGPGSGSILLDNVDCLGTELNLAQCTYYNYPTPGSHNCGHHEDASVVCTNDSKYFKK